MPASSTPRCMRTNNPVFFIKTKKMYYVKKTLEISASHRLTLDYESKCENLHGHNWLITVYCKARTLDQNGMVCDFSVIKRKLNDTLDHKNLNEVFAFNPTAENMARWIVDNIPGCYRADVRETANNLATYINDEDEQQGNMI